MSDTAWGGFRYPDPPLETEEPECAYCGFALSDEVYDLNNDIVCQKCFEEQILEEIGWEGISDALGFRHMTKEGYVNEYL